MKHRFILISRWQLDCGIDAAWQRVHAVRRWPLWWPNVRAVQVSGEADAALPLNHDIDELPRVGSTAWIEWKTHLGYGLKLRVTTTSVLPPHELEGAADGDLEGSGLWLLEPRHDGGVLVTYR